MVVHAANIQDYQGARLVFMKLRGLFPRLRLIWADGIYAYTNLVEWVGRFAGWVLEIVKKPKDQKGFAVLPRRWVVERTVVERTFAWLGKYRRLSRDYEHSTASGEAMIRLAMIHLMVRRLAPRQGEAAPT